MKVIDKYLLPIIAATLILAGALRLALMPAFRFSNAVWALLCIPIAAVALLVCDFVRYRTRASLWIFAVVLLAAAILSKHFCIALGVVLLGIWIYNVAQ
ncbi:MAG TPA: hypothetical protein VHA33_18865 [Candidatus Angelobacter sp.]|jgi:hypothetical protein|nr:hypothetical protein [Candidatus Angelobacter sp.]